MRAKLLFLLLAASLIPVSADELKYLEFHKSVPIEVNSLEFVAATQAQWIGRVGGLIRPIEIQLLITNRSKSDIVFRTCDTFAVHLRDADGKEIPDGGGRNGLIASLSVLIHAGDTYYLSRKAELCWKLPPYPWTFDAPDRKGGTISVNSSPQFESEHFGWKPDGKSSALFYWDGTGFLGIHELLNPGSFVLSFSIGSSENQAAAETKKLRGLQVWAGKVTTKEVPFEIIEEAN